MGCFTVPCGLSGLPITDGQPIVGFHVKTSGPSMGRNGPWEPVNLPVVGKYDDYGRLVQENGNKLDGNSGFHLVLCHKSLWDAIVADGKKHLKDDWSFRGETIDFKTYFALVKDSFDKRYADIKAEVGMLDGDVKSILREMLDNPTQMVISCMEVKPDGIHNLFFSSCSDYRALRTEIAGRIVDEKMPTDEECVALEEMAYVFMHTYLRGRPVTPTNICYTAQCVDHKRTTNWFRAVTKTARLCKRKRKNRNVK